jgi:co-chaperonin GroES (HSP10)
MIQPRTKTSGGIILTDKSREAMEFQRTMGLVIRLGPMCYKERRHGDVPWCKVGDWVYMNQYTGNPIEIMGHSYRFLNDDQAKGEIPDPSVVKMGGYD